MHCPLSAKFLLREVSRPRIPADSKHNLNASILPRCNGILLHVTSLPAVTASAMGDSACEFIEFLAQSQQKIWQVLPLGPTGYGDSPTSYSRPSPAIRSSSIGIRFESEACCCHRIWTAPRACRTTTSNTADPSQAGFNPQSGAHFWQMALTQIAWLSTFLSWQRRLAGRLFASYGGQGVYKDGVRSDWDLEIRQRDSSALGEWRQKLSAGMEVHKFAQFEFFSQWKKLRDESQSHGISIMGDIPIYRSTSLPTVPMFRPSGGVSSG